MTSSALDALQRLLAEAGRGGTATCTDRRPEHLDAIRLAADALLATAGSQAAGETLAAAALAELARTSPAPADAIAVLLRAAETSTGASPLRTTLLALSDSDCLIAPLACVAQAYVSIICAGGGAEGVALWRLESDEPPTLMACAGMLAPAATLASVERALRWEPGSRDFVIEAFDEPCAVLTWVDDPQATGSETFVIASQAAALLRGAFERATLLDGAGAQHGTPAREADRRLSRLAFDLHDGPAQDVALLRRELAALHRVLTDGSRGDLEHVAAVAQLEDVMAIAEATETDLRDLAASMGSPSLMQRPFAEALHGVARAFTLRAGIEPQVTVEGDLAGLASIERVAVLRVVGEALANAREHARATAIDISVHVGTVHVEALVRDDGCGFDVDSMLPEAARRGRLGLLGMMERIRMIDGHCHVISVVGTGTTVSLEFPRSWPGLALDEPGAARAA